MKLNQKLAKKVLAVALTLAMVVTSLFVMPTTANAATGATIGRYTSVKAGKTVKTTVRNLGKNYYAKVSTTGTAAKGVTITRVNGNKVTATTKIQGTGNNIKLNVKNWNVPGKSYKLVIKTYSKKTNKLVRTYTTKSTFVYKTLTNVTLDETAEVVVGKTVELKAVKTPATATTKLTWSSSDETVATVNAGVVTGVKAGEATITVKSANGKEASCKVTVKADLSAAQTGAKSFTVTGDAAALKDAKISVTRGNNTVSSTTKVTDDKAVITLSANIMAEDYVIVVGESKITVKGEVAKLSKIEILSDLAIASSATVLPTADANGTATVNYAAYNQFGEDITKTTSVSVSCSLDSTLTTGTTDGELTVKLPKGTKEGDLASMVIVNGTTGISATKVVKVSAKAVVSEVAFGALYNKDGKTLTEGTLADDFYQIVELKDQYGEAILDPAAYSQVIVTPIAGLTAIAFDASFVNVTVDGSKKLALHLTKKAITAGNASVLVIAKNTGKSAQTSFEVVNGVKVDKFNASPAGMVVGGETAIFDFTATDTYGKEIANPTASMFAPKNGVPTGFTFVKNAKTGKTELHYAAASTATNMPVYATFITKTNTVINVSFTVYKDAYPVAISKFSNFYPGMIAAASKTAKLDASQVVFEDQYGREMDAADALKTINTVAYTLDAAANAVPANLTVKQGAAGTYATDVTTTGLFTLASTDGIQVTATTTAASLGFTLTLKAAGVAVDSKSVAFESAALDDLSGFAVNDIALVAGYTGAVDKTLTVTGKTENGVVVKLADTEYTVVGQLANAGGTAINGNNIFGTSTEVTTKDGKYTVVIKNNVGTEVDKTVKVSNEAVRPVSINLVDAIAYDANNTLTIGNTTIVTNAELKGAVEVLDQYGNAYTATTPRIVVATTDIDGGAVTITSNGTAAAAITVVGATKVITVTYKFDNGVTFTTNLKLNQ